MFLPFCADTDIFRLVGTWHFYNDCAIGLHKGAKIKILLQNIYFLQIHLKKHDWSSIISIRVNGIETSVHDLYNPSWTETIINIFESNTPSDIAVEIENVDKNHSSQGLQLIFYGLTFGYEKATSAKDFPSLTDKTKDMILNYCGGNEELYRNHLVKYPSFIDFFSKLSRYKSLKGASVLEVGCGIGMSTVVLRQMGAKVIAGDYDEGNTLATARKIAQDFRVDDSFCKLDVRDLPFDDETFDYVHCEQVLEHIPGKDHENALKEICRVVKKGGLLFIDTENQLCPLDRHDSGLLFVHWLPKKIGVWVAKRMNKGITINELSFNNINPTLHDYMSYFEMIRITKKKDFNLISSYYPFDNINDLYSGQQMNSRVMDCLCGLLKKKAIYFLPIHFLLKKRNGLECELNYLSYIEKISREDDRMERVQDNKNINIEQIMSQIRDNVHHKKQSGLYVDADIKTASNLSLDIPLLPSSGEGLSDQVAYLLQNYDFRTGYQISSHRPLLGKIIVPIKRLIIWSAFKLAGPVWERNISYNFHVVQLLSSLSKEVDVLKKECAELIRLHESDKRP